MIVSGRVNFRVVGGVVGRRLKEYLKLCVYDEYMERKRECWGVNKVSKLNKGGMYKGKKMIVG